MLKFLLKKIVYGFLVLAGVVVVVFTLFNLLPVDPARLTMGQRADVESVEAINKERQSLKAERERLEAQLAAAINNFEL